MQTNQSKLEKVKEIMQSLKQDTLKEVISIKLTDEKPSLYDSKFGGTPYLPLNEEIPTNKDGQQLRLLAQINFENIVENNILPKEGILQFYIF